jgi:hypothetical protein
MNGHRPRSLPLLQYGRLRVYVLLNNHDSRAYFRLAYDHRRCAGVVASGMLSP